MEDACLFQFRNKFRDRESVEDALNVGPFVNESLLDAAKIGVRMRLH